MQHYRATLRGVDLEAIRQFYYEARRLTRETGIPHEVDHIVPLNSARCSGLHVPWNLQVIPKADNCRKSNRLDNERARRSAPVPVTGYERQPWEMDIEERERRVRAMPVRLRGADGKLKHETTLGQVEERIQAVEVL